MDTQATHGAPERYEFAEIEQRWQALWEERETFSARDDDPRPKLYVLQMFPYPSGDLHAGHIRNYVLGDAVARYWRMRGYNVMHPMGFDSFGLPAEQAAIDRNIQPSDWIETCVQNSRRQFKRYGFSFDWSREVVTSTPEYYRFTQWLFLKFHELGLVYRKEIEVNWCEEHGVLANDEVKDGGCWRCERPVSKKKLAQWLMRTTDYAQELLDGLDELPGWNDAVRTMQRNWIGRSEGTLMDFPVPALVGMVGQASSLPGGDTGKMPAPPVLTVFTTRIDTIFGCTFMAIAPDHPLAEAIARAGGTLEELRQFAVECARESAAYGVDEEKPKRGLRLNAKCINSFNGEALPIFAVNYVISDFGTGAVMAVPAHDTRDHAFALEYGLPIRPVIAPADSVGTWSAAVPGLDSVEESRSAAVPGRDSTSQTEGLQITRRRLPHWRLSGSVYFVTWRLRHGLAELSPDARTIIASALRHFDGQLYELLGYVVMNDHVHVMVKPLAGFDLSGLMHSWRSFTANRLQRECGYQGAVWQDDYFDRIMRGEQEFWETMEYLVNNPQKRWPEILVYEWLFWRAPGENDGQGRPPSSTEAATEGRPPVYPDCYPDKGVCVNSGEFDGLEFDAAKTAMDAWLAERNLGGASVQYRLRDWNMSRQRFWGAPLPMLHCDKPEQDGGCGWQRVPYDDLPVRLPELADYSDIRVSPLANDAAWQRAKCPQCGGPATRETDTMTTFMDSAWYFLRFCDPANAAAPFARELVEAWMPVDYYVGGKEHAVGHLLYSRFITRVLAKAGLLQLHKPDHAGQLPMLESEPFRRLFNQGIVYKDGAKMSKSRGNVVSADGLADEHGADTARLFAFFGGPYDMDLEWTTAGVDGCQRFLRRLWRLGLAVAAKHLSADDGDPAGALETYDEALRDCDIAALRARHRAVAGVTEDLAHWRFNTAVAKMMEFLNELDQLWKQAGEIDPERVFTVSLLCFAQLLSPFAPHIAEELWLRLGGMGLCCESDWPEYDAQMLVTDTVELPVQVNGKLRGKIVVAREADEQSVLAAAKADPTAAKWLEGKELVKALYVPGRMVTFVVK